MMNELSDPIKEAFRCMGQAEEILRKHGLSKHPRAFALLCPTEGMTGMVPAVYASHAEELCKRIVDAGEAGERGEQTSVLLPPSLRVPTSAELLIALSNHSLKQPLNAAYSQVFAELFLEVLGTLPQGVKLREGAYSYPAERQEILAELRRVGMVKRSELVG